ncbi:hypothetical protein HYH03_019183, partial [Edaphochlamys debaryana]
SASASVAAIAPAPGSTSLTPGVYRPSGNLSHLLPPAGAAPTRLAGSAWALRVLDNATKDAGAVLGWNLTLWGEPASLSAYSAPPQASLSAAAARAPFSTPPPTKPSSSAEAPFPAPAQASLTPKAAYALQTATAPAPLAAPTQTPPSPNAPEPFAIAGRVSLSISHQGGEVTWYVARLNDSANFRLPGQPRSAATNLTVPAGALVNMVGLSPSKPGTLAANVSVSLLVIVLRLSESEECGESAGADVAGVSNVLWAEGGVAAQLAACSHGRFRLLRNSSQMISVTLPCRVEVTACDTVTTANLAKDAIDTSVKRGLLRGFTHRMFVMPGDSQCSWSGLGEMGGVETWLTAGPQGVYKPGAVMQELLHNFGLHHGWRDGSEYADFSTWMGSAYSACPSAPELLKLGWATPLVTLNSSNLPAASTLTNLTLRATYLSGSGVMIRILPDWLPFYRTSDSTNLYLSLRVRGGADQQLDGEYDYKLSVHEAISAVDNSPPTAEKDPRFNLTALLDQGEKLTLKGHGLVIQARELSDDGTRMLVDVCRFRYNSTLECRLLPAVGTVCPIVPGYTARRDVDCSLPAASNNLGLERSLGALASFCNSEPRGCRGFSWDSRFQAGYWKASVTPTQAALGICLYSKIMPPPPAPSPPSPRPPPLPPSPGPPPPSPPPKCPSVTGYLVREDVVHTGDDIEALGLMNDWVSLATACNLDRACEGFGWRPSASLGSAKLNTTVTACPSLTGFEAGRPNARRPSGSDLTDLGGAASLAALAWACFRDTRCVGLEWSFRDGRGAAKGNVTGGAVAATGWCAYEKIKPKLATGGYHACALWSGSLKCWGVGDRGQLGSGGRDDVAAGWVHTCVILEPGGAVKCWGDNASGQLGLGDTDQRELNSSTTPDLLPTVDLGPRLRALKLFGGVFHTCAVLQLLGNSSTIVKCWGDNMYGTLLDGTKASRGRYPGSMGVNLPAALINPGMSPSGFGLSIFQSCVLLQPGGRVKCSNSSKSGLDPDLVDFLDLGAGVEASAISGFGEHICLILQPGSRLKCFGSNYKGQLGLGTGPSAPDWTSDLPFVDVGDGVKELSGGQGYFTCAVLESDGGVKCWGDNEYGPLGLGDTVQRGSDPSTIPRLLLPVELGSGRTAAQLVEGTRFACATLRPGYGVKCWGWITGYGDNPGEMGDALPFVDLGWPGLW